MKTVYLLTDDPAVADSAQRTYPEYHWKSAHYNRDAARGGDPDAAFVDMFLAAKAAAFVGTLSSCFGRVITMLGLHARGAPMPFVALDEWEWRELAWSPGHTGVSQLCRMDDHTAMINTAFRCAGAGYVPSLQPGVPRVRVHVGGDGEGFCRAVGTKAAGG